MGGKVIYFFRRLPPPAKTAGRVIAALILTYIPIAAYNAIFQTSHPYLIALYPVIVCALLLGFWPGMIALGASALYFGHVLLQAAEPGEQLVMMVIFLMEGITVLWLVHVRRQAAIRLGMAMIQTELELVKIRRAYKHLTSQEKRVNLSAGQLRESNRIMIDTLERILDEHDGRKGVL